ncbi:TlpA family protein disulfide reductase [Sandaracinus amylolyticus]|uniref:TlpA family protein disulfide reductase n=1 Tax=Sandaracinus amylolyticus TaxID=927083 RepID=UPI001F2E2EB9|nr:TlpA disulfide reductase family protein [Sandaracinus amylolyticus]UJR84917.1 Hypothetical protein I5071_69960 [Sandaracinus amylolyticus]
MISAALAAAGCGGEEATITPEGAAPVAPSRVEAVAARDDDPARRFCDVSAAVGEGRELALPPLEGPSAPTSGWRWINVWATWCAPCVEELPRIVAWRARLAEEGTPIEPYFVSVDGSAEDVATWRGAHPDAPESARMTDPAGLSPFFASLGLDAATSIPIHALVDPTGHVRCVRAGAVAERDYATVRAILRTR